ncbi:CD209 antigen isoform X1 [Fukomys damarensis]|uniref:CD209 antigen-like protein 2 n=1 Tax=Fukomys damarensis TaxID=885580 RepID=A0A091DJJ1_FUKDA|nr:CD209 antigen isoform X1 [Fukomys damarensis]KFO22971.1 CD209 antigen-like protein 2 [Fukomys damarensis]
MSNNRAQQQLGPLDEEELITSGPKCFTKSFGCQPTSTFNCYGGCLGNYSISLLLQILALTLFAGLLLAILAQVSRGPSLQELEQEQSKQEKIFQELNQLKTRVDRLCRPCPWDWTIFQGRCYFFSKSQRDWHESVTACQEAGAQLVIVESAEEQSFLQQTSKSKGRTWMGLSDLNKESEWRWVDGSPLSLSFMKYWNPGEPNSSGEEDCAEFYGDGWNDSKCHVHKFFICERSAASCST